MTPVADERASEVIDAVRRDRPEVVQLAEAASLAVRVEPHLLRRLRIDLCPGIDVGIEADLWFSDLVETIGPRYIMLDHDVVATLRHGLRDRPGLLDRIARVTREEHVDSPPSLRLEEQLNHLAVRGGPNLRTELNEALRPALRTIADGGPAARDLAQWALRALPRLFPGALDCENGMALTMAASAVLGQRRVVQQVPESDLPIEHVAWALPADATTETAQLWLTLVGDGVRIDDFGAADQAIDVPATTPLLLELSWASADGSLLATLVQAEPGRPISLEPGVTEVTIRTLTGEEYLLAATATPDGGGSATESSTAAPEADEGTSRDVRRAAITIGVDVTEKWLAPPPQRNLDGASALLLRLDHLGYGHLAIGPTRQRELLTRAPRFPNEVELLWLHIVGPGKIRHREDAPLGGLHSIGLADEDRRLEWVPIDQLVEEVFYTASSAVLMTIEVTSSVDVDSYDTPPRVQEMLNQTVLGGALIVGVTNGGVWEDHGPLTHILLDALPTELGPAPQLTIDELARHMREEWDRWAADNDYERDTLAIVTFGRPGLPLVGTADEASQTGLAADTPTTAPELPPDVPRTVDLDTFAKLAESVADEDAAWLDIGRARAGSVCTIRSANGRRAGSGFLVRAADVGELGGEETLVVTTTAVVLAAQSEDPTQEPSAESITLDHLVVDVGIADAGTPHRRNATVLWSADAVDAALLRLQRGGVDDVVGLPLAGQTPLPDGEQRVYLIGDLTGDGSLHVGLDDNELLDVQEARLHYRLRVEPSGAGSPVFDSAWNVVGMHLASSESMPRLHGVEGVYAASEGLTIAAIRERYEADLAAEGYGEQDAAETFAESYESDVGYADDGPVTAEKATLYDEDGAERSDFEPEILNERGSGRVGKTARRLWNRVTGRPDDTVPRIYVSYMRADGPDDGRVGRIVDRLRRSFGDDAVWWDVGDIVGGELWSAAIDRAIGGADVVLAVIGPKWSPKAFVIHEIGAALRTNANVIPVLVGGADFPSEDVLPPEISEMVTRQAVTIRDISFDDDVENLERSIRGLADRSRKS